MYFLVLFCVLVGSSTASTLFQKPPLKVGRITNGQAAWPKQFPYQVGLQLYRNGGNNWAWCGGTLLSNEWVLTAAHCIVNTETVKVILGSLRIRTNGGDVGEIVVMFPRNDGNVILHKDFDYHSLTNDLALIHLPGPVQLSEYIKPAKLPKFYLLEPTYAGTWGTISGWGRLSNRRISDTLQYAHVPIISHAACTVYYKGRPATEICIGTQDTYISTCNGDSGGPLVLFGTDTIVGVASYVSKYGCEVGYPAGFARVTSHLDWIKEISGISP